MFLTERILIKNQAPEQYIDFLKNNYSKGVEFSELCENYSVPKDFLYWIFENFSFNSKDQNSYNSALAIDEKSEMIWKSSNVSESKIVYESDNVEKSSGIFLSEDVRNSTNIFISRAVKNSTNVKESSFVSFSEEVFSSRNVTNSIQVYDSIYVQNGTDIFHSNQVVNSDIIFESDYIQNCSFCSSCKNLINGMFCLGFDGEAARDKFFLFNKEVPEVVYTSVCGQYIDLVKECHVKFLNFDERLKNGEIAIKVPDVEVTFNFQKRFAGVTDKFWDWVKTLPNYNEEILYGITFVPKVLIDK